MWVAARAVAEVVAASAAVKVGVARAGVKVEELEEGGECLLGGCVVGWQGRCSRQHW
jgi:hypothetical protein